MDQTTNTETQRRRRTNPQLNVDNTAEDVRRQVIERRDMSIKLLVCRCLQLLKQHQNHTFELNSTQKKQKRTKDTEKSKEEAPAQYVLEESRTPSLQSWAHQPVALHTLSTTPHTTHPLQTLHSNIHH